MRLKPLAFFLALSLFLAACTGCGIDNFIYLYPVTQLLNSPSSDPAANYYKFRTTGADNSANASGYFKGFEIYYRIYNSTAQSSQDTSDISAYNTANPTTVFNYLTAVKKYRRLTSEGRKNDFPLIPADNADSDVVIRLIDYGLTDPANLTVGTVNYGTPRRTVNDGTATDSFVYAEITNTDTDVQYITTGDADKWYVQAYVFAYGYDSAYKAIYSSAFGLGLITVPSQ